MSRLRAGEVAVILDRIGQDFPEEVSKLSAHIEAVASEDSFTRLVRDVSETVGEQRGFITEQRGFIKEQRTFIASQQVLLQSATEAIAALAAAQDRANILEERKQQAAEAALKHEREAEKLREEHDREMARMREQHDQAIQRTQIEKVLVPAISGIMGLLTGAGSSYLMSLSGG